jgi:gamma-glutamyl-gamma-aminobutyrate hydrolase PuuD
MQDVLATTTEQINAAHRQLALTVSRDLNGLGTEADKIIEDANKYVEFLAK